MHEMNGLKRKWLWRGRQDRRGEEPTEEVVSLKIHIKQLNQKSPNLKFLDRLWFVRVENGSWGKTKYTSHIFHAGQREWVMIIIMKYSYSTQELDNNRYSPMLVFPTESSEHSQDSR